MTYGLTFMLRGGRLACGHRHRLRGLAIFGLYIVATALIPGNRRMTLYSIQTLKRRRSAWFQEDLAPPLELPSQGKIKPLIAERIPLVEAARAHELLGKTSVMGKIAMLRNRLSLDPLA